MFLKLFKEVWDARGGLAALELAEQRFAGGPTAARALLYLGKAYVQQGCLANAATHLREALAFFEKQPKTQGLNYNLYAQIARDLLADIPE
jgi:hypothetical protein